MPRGGGEVVNRPAVYIRRIHKYLYDGTYAAGLFRMYAKNDLSKTDRKFHHVPTCVWARRAGRVYLPVE